MAAKTWDFRPNQLEAFKGTGYELIPLHRPNAIDERGRPIGKAPYKGWRKDNPITMDEAIAHMADGGNVGVRMRETDLVIDVDPRNFVEGDDPLARLQADLGVDFADWPKVVTGSGGFHIYMTIPAGTLLRDTLEDYQGIEFKAHGRQLVSPGSVHPEAEKPYLWDDDALAPTLKDKIAAPSGLLELAKRPGRISAVDAGDFAPEQLSEMLEGLDPTAFQDHDKWLEIMMACHHATAGEGRDEFLEWSTSDPRYVKDAWLIGRRWDSLHADGGGRRVTVKTLFKRLIDAGQSERIPRATAQDDFPEDDYSSDEVQGGTDLELDEILATLPEGGPETGPLEAMNAAGYAVVNENGMFRVYRRKVDYLWGDEPREYWETYRKTDFVDFLSNQRIQKIKGDTVQIKPLATEWLNWGGRTTYEGIAFDPGNRIPKKAKILNLWTDWAVEPKKGHWDMMKQLLLEALCDGNEEMYNYVLDWSAFMVQHPDRPAEVALVFRGAKGTGKGTYFRALASLAGRHSMHINNQHHFTSNFNSHLRDCIFLFADEAMWAGDKKSEGTLKALITEPTMIIEGKGKDVITARNHLHIGMASNEDWVFPASMDDERRLAISDVNNKFRGNVAFFTQLNKQLKDGGLAAMLFDLKTRDISKFHPRKNVPQTKALANQKLQSLDSFDNWYYECLCSGDMSNGNGVVQGHWGQEGNSIVFVDDLRESLEAHLRSIGDRYFSRRGFDTMVGMRLARRLPDRVAKVRLRCPDHRLDLKTDVSGRVYGYELPSLHECRAAFEAQLGSTLPWQSTGHKDETVDLDANVRDID